MQFFYFIMHQHFLSDLREDFASWSCFRGFLLHRNWVFHFIKSALAEKDLQYEKGIYALALETEQTWAFLLSLPFCRLSSLSPPSPSLRPPLTPCSHYAHCLLNPQWKRIFPHLREQIPVQKNTLVMSTETDIQTQTEWDDMSSGDEATISPTFRDGFISADRWDTFFHTSLFKYVDIEIFTQPWFDGVFLWRWSNII